ncbi:type 3 dihydrofolate reductase [Thiohalomonas denitrificans]|uniref:Dihydrofolate reductase n=1 Tax=Thiohalomonas denitrificans TaxID=415747 RepID=A0A1G5Q9X5_9GAMM|nr:type 3 dihydrofolate reductase [Thiohalomonas denitrificans]SCZ58418.1 dihydrofolate reductase [Thiohalomonas denitrificans]
MRISIIAAMAEDRVIGIENRLPWSLPADMQWFRRHTLGKPVIMGRKTFESIGRPLPKRTNVVVTGDPSYRAEGCRVVHSIDAALEAAQPAEEVMVIGGATFYQQILPRADRLYLTRVHAVIEGDAWFPSIDSSEWRETEREERPADADNPHGMAFQVLERK